MMPDTTPTTDAKRRLAERDAAAARLAEQYVANVTTRRSRQRHPSARTNMPSREETLFQALLEACRDLTPYPAEPEEPTKAGDQGW